MGLFVEREKTGARLNYHFTLGGAAGEETPGFLDGFLGEFDRKARGLAPSKPPVLGKASYVVAGFNADFKGYAANEAHGGQPDALKYYLKLEALRRLQTEGVHTVSARLEPALLAELARVKLVKLEGSPSRDLLESWVAADEGQRARLAGKLAVALKQEGRESFKAPIVFWINNYRAAFQQEIK